MSNKLLSTFIVVFAVAGFSQESVFVMKSDRDKVRALQNGTSRWDSAYETAISATDRIFSVENRTSDWNKAYSLGVESTNRVSVLESGTSVWNAAYQIGVESTNRITSLENNTSSWNSAYSLGIDSTGRISLLESETSTWNRAYQLGVDSTNRILSLENGTSDWDTAYSLGIDSTNRLSFLESETSFWNYAYFLVVDSTNRILSLENGTSKWDTAYSLSTDSTGRISSIESNTDKWDKVTQKVDINSGVSSNQTLVDAIFIGGGVITNGQDGLALLNGPLIVSNNVAVSWNITSYGTNTAYVIRSESGDVYLGLTNYGPRIVNSITNGQSEAVTLNGSISANSNILISSYSDTQAGTPLIVQNTAPYGINGGSQFSQIWRNSDGSMLASLKNSGAFTVNGGVFSSNFLSIAGPESGFSFLSGLKKSGLVSSNGIDDVLTVIKDKAITDVNTNGMSVNGDFTVTGINTAPYFQTVNGNVTNRVLTTADKYVVDIAQPEKYLATMVNGSGTVYEISGPYTNYMVTLDNDFRETDTGTRPAWTNNAFPFEDGDWRGVILDYYEGMQIQGPSGSYWQGSYLIWVEDHYEVSFPALLPSVSGNAQGNALVSISGFYYQTNAIHHFTTEAELAQLSSDLGVHLTNTVIASTNALAGQLKTEIEATVTNTVTASTNALVPYTRTLYGDLTLTNEDGYAAFNITNPSIQKAHTVVGSNIAGTNSAFMSWPVSGGRPFNAKLIAYAILPSSVTFGMSVLSVCDSFGAVISSNVWYAPLNGSSQRPYFTNELSAISAPTNGYLRWTVTIGKTLGFQAVSIWSGGSSPLTLELSQAPIEYATAIELKQGLIGVVTNGQSGVHFSPDNRFGIGTNTPQEALHVNGNAIIESNMTILGTAGISNSLNVASNITARTGDIGGVSATETNVTITGKASGTGTTSVEILSDAVSDYINYAFKVGLKGETYPFFYINNIGQARFFGNRLSVDGSIWSGNDSASAISDSEQNGMWFPSGGGVVLKTSGEERFNIKPDGDVSISNNLNVGGNAVVVSNVYANDFIVPDLNPSNGYYNVPSVYRNILDTQTNMVILENQTIYRVDASTSVFITNDISGLDFVNHEAKWEIWLNIMTTNAFNTTFATNFEFSQTPDFTVTGEYKFACSSIGNKIQVKQVYPTVYGIIAVPYCRGDNNFAYSAYVNVLDEGTTNGAYIAFIKPDKHKYYMAKLNVYFSNADCATNTINIRVGTGIYGGVDTILPEVAMLRGNPDEWYAGSSTGLIMFSPIAINGWQNYEQTEHWGIFVATRFATNGTVGCKRVLLREANELEVKAYNAGWRP